MTHTDVVILDVGDKIIQRHTDTAFLRDSVWIVTGIEETGVNTVGETILHHPHYIPFRDLRKEYEREETPCR